MPKQQVLKSGMKAPESGQYAVVDPQKGKLPIEVTVVKGEPMPPTPKAGQGFVLVDPTKHKE